MNTSESPIILESRDKQRGFFSSTNSPLDPEQVYNFCQNKENVENVLQGLPLNLDNFLELVLDSSKQNENDQYEIRWINKPESKFEGSLTLHIISAPANRGSLVTAIADFEKVNFKTSKPSTLIEIFLRRMKALMETGEIATTKGQTSGRKEHLLH